MTFLPIVQRELRVAARKPSTYRARMWFVLVTSLMAGLLLLTRDPVSGAASGSIVFPALTTLAFFYCLLAGVRYTADCLSEEKREGTLGLLFLTDLRGYDVVLGKLISASARTFQGLFAFFPVLAVGLLTGGITAGEFWRATAVLTNTLFFSVCVGLWASAMTRESHAALATAAGLLVLFVGFPIGGTYLSNALGYTALQPIRFVSPAGAAQSMWDAAYQAHPGRFWAGLLANHLLGWLMLALASRVVPRSWQEGSAEATVIQRSPQPTSPATESNTDKRDVLRQRLLDINPILWLAGRYECSRLLLWTFIAVAVTAGLLVLSMAYALPVGSFGMSSILSFGLSLFLKVWVAWQACATLAEARRTGAVELLLATPLRVDEIIRGHWQALQRIFTWPVLVTLVVSILPAIEAHLQQPPSASNLIFWPISGVTVFGIATLILDLLALAWVGMWMGLTQPRAIQAFAKTILFVTIIPAFIFCLPNILFDLFWISWARKKLEKQFRIAAVERYDVPQPATWLSPAFPTVRPPIISGSRPV